MRLTDFGGQVNAITIGTVLDRYGPKVTAIIGSLFFALGTLLFALGSDGLLPAKVKG